MEDLMIADNIMHSSCEMILYYSQWDDFTRRSMLENA